MALSQNAHSWLRSIAGPFIVLLVGGLVAFSGFATEDDVEKLKETNAEEHVILKEAQDAIKEQVKEIHTILKILLPKYKEAAENGK